MAVTSKPPNAEGDTRQRILASALQVFLQKGYAGATTRAIAMQAGVNEVTLFRHFGNKHSLLTAVVTEYSPLPDLKTFLEKQLSGDYDYDLKQLTAHLINRIMQQPDLTPLLVMETRQFPELKDTMMGLFSELLALLAQYFDSQQRLGNVRANLHALLISYSYLSLIAGF